MSHRNKARYPGRRQLTGPANLAKNRRRRVLTPEQQEDHEWRLSARMAHPLKPQPVTVTLAPLAYPQQTGLIPWLRGPSRFVLEALRRQAAEAAAREEYNRVVGLQ